MIERPKFRTMDDAYGDGSNHLVCEECGMCLSCGDCMCNEIWKENDRKH